MLEIDGLSNPLYNENIQGDAMGTSLAVTACKYNATSRYLKIFYNNGSGELYHPVPEFIYNNLLRCSDKTAFVQKYLEYDLHFHKMSII